MAPRTSIEKLSVLSCCRVALEVNQPSGSTYLQEAYWATGSAYPGVNIIDAHVHSVCLSCPVMRRRINSLTLLTASFYTK